MAEELAILINAKDGFSETFRKLDTRVFATQRIMGRATDASKTFMYALGGLAVAAGGVIVSSTLTAARTETLGIAMNAVAKATGTSTEVLAEQEKILKKQGITTQEARGILTLFMQSQLDVAQASKVARVAQDLAVIANVNSSVAARSLTDAIASQEPMLLRQFGIVKNLPEIYEKYGRELGIVTDKVDKNGKVTQAWARELTEAEKKQAFLNIILEQGAKVTGVYEDAMTKAGKKLTSLPRYFEEAANAIGQVFLPALNWGIDTLTEFLKSITTENIEKWIERIKEAKFVVALLAGAISGMMLPALADMIENFTLSSLSLSPFTAIGMVVATTIYLLWKYWTQFNEALQAGPGHFSFWLVSLLALVNPIVAVAMLIATVRSRWQELRDYFQTFAAEHKESIDSIRAKMDEWWGKVSEIVNYIKAKYQEFITSSEYRGLVASFNNLMNQLRTLANIVTGETGPSMDSLRGKHGELASQTSATKQLIDFFVVSLKTLALIASYAVGFIAGVVAVINAVESVARGAASQVERLYRALSSISKTWYGRIIFPGMAGVPGYQAGGPVPGPIGKPQLAVVHGGEYVLPARPMLAGAGAANFSSVIHTHVHLDGKQIAESVDYHAFGVGENI